MLIQGHVQDPIGVGERSLDVPVGVHVGCDQHVRTDVLQDGHAGRVEGLLGRCDRRQVLVLDLDQLQGVLSQVTGIGDDDRHQVTHQADLVGSQARVMGLSGGSSPAAP